MKPKKETKIQNKNMNNLSFENLFGFSLSELTSWKSFVSLMCRPMDPASLGVTRILFGEEM